MNLRRIGSLLLALAAALTVSLTPASAYGEDWLIPKLRDYAAFTDTAGTICETAAATCCQAGLMDGVDSRHFLPSTGLSHAQIIVISARLHRLLSGGTLEYFEPISLTGPDWWTPYDGYLREQIPALAEDPAYGSLRESPTASCYRQEFFHLLAAVLNAAGAALPEINAVYAVPDCDLQEILQFYRWGVLSGKDAYGTLEGSAALSRAAAAAMLARLIDPAQRLTLQLKQLELCQELLGVDPETVLMTVSGKEITAECFMPALVKTLSGYNHSHFASMSLELSGGSPLEEAVKTFCQEVLCETLAEELKLDIPPSDTAYFSGYRGLTANGQAWEDYHTRLFQGVVQALDQEPFPMDRIPQPEYAEIWDTLPLSDLSQHIWDLPYWGGGF